MGTSASQYLAFLAVSLLVICTPGQDTALTVRNTLAGGRRSGVSTAFGVAAGQATWTIATSAGLAAVLTASGPLFLAVKLAGAAYLVYLGARSLLTVARPGADASRTSVGRIRPHRGLGAAFGQGLLSNLTNAKMIAFFISLLPQFSGPHPGLWLLVTLGLNFSLLTLAWLTMYAFAVHQVGGWLRGSAARRVLDGLLGATLIGLGVRLGAEAA